MQELKAAVTFTEAELWMLNDLIRHEEEQQDTWRFAPASLEINDEVAYALDSCARFKLEEYTLMLSRGDLLVIDYNVRREYKAPDGGSGRSILLKSFKARKQLADGGQLDESEERDAPYMEANARATNSTQSD